MAVFDENVRLPWDSVLMNSLDPADPEDREVIGILKRLEAKALRNADSGVRRVVVPSKDTVADSKELNESVTKLEVTQNQQVTETPKRPGGRRRQHSNAAEKQKAYRSRVNGKILHGERGRVDLLCSSVQQSGA
jgi:hypothetical protein